MMLAVVGCLAIVALYLGKRLSDVNSENATLRDQIASLKRQLGKRRA